MPETAVNPAGEAAPSVPVVAPATTVAPVPVTAPAPQSAAPAPAVAATSTVTPAQVVTQDPADPNWLNARLAKAKTSAERDAQAAFLKTLGVDSLEAAKAKIAAANEAENARLSAQEKADKRIKELEPEAQRATRLLGVVVKTAEREMSALTEEQRTAIKQRAGDDPAAQLDTIEWLRSAGMITAPASTAAPATAQAPKVPVPAPATTSTANGAPAPAVTSETDHKSVYETLLKSNPIEAAYYADRFGPQIFK